VRASARPATIWPRQKSTRRCVPSALARWKHCSASAKALLFDQQPAEQVESHDAEARLAERFGAADLGLQQCHCRPRTAATAPRFGLQDAQRRQVPFLLGRFGDGKTVAAMGKGAPEVGSAHAAAAAVAQHHQVLGFVGALADRARECERTFEPRCRELRLGRREACLAIAVIGLDGDDARQRMPFAQIDRLGVAAQRAQVVAVAPRDRAEVVQGVGDAMRLVERARGGERLFEALGRPRVVVGAPMRHAEAGQQVAGPCRVAEPARPGERRFERVHRGSAAAVLRMDRAESLVQPHHRLGVGDAGMRLDDRERALERPRGFTQREQAERAFGGALVLAHCAVPLLRRFPVLGDHRGVVGAAVDQRLGGAAMQHDAARRTEVVVDRFADPVVVEVVDGTAVDLRAAGRRWTSRSIASASALPTMCVARSRVRKSTLRPSTAAMSSTARGAACSLATRSRIESRSAGGNASAPPSGAGADAGPSSRSCCSIDAT
jgi:hypothetical protein